MRAASKQWLTCTDTPRRRTSSFTAHTTRFTMRITSGWGWFRSYSQKTQPCSVTSHANSSWRPQRWAQPELSSLESSESWIVSPLRHHFRATSRRRGRTKNSFRITTARWETSSGPRSCKISTSGSPTRLKDWLRFVRKHASKSSSDRNARKVWTGASSSGIKFSLKIMSPLLTLLSHTLEFLGSQERNRRMSGLWVQGNVD